MPRLRSILQRGQISRCDKNRYSHDEAWNIGAALNAWIPSNLDTHGRFADDGSISEGVQSMLRRLIIIFLLSFTSIANCNAQIVALGASSTAGFGVGWQAAYPAQLEEILRAKGHPMSVRNEGISGDTTGGMLARLPSAVPPGTKIVILQTGGNDYAKRMNMVEARANRAEIRRQLRARGIRIIEAGDIVESIKRSDGLPPGGGGHPTAEGQRKIALQIAAQVLPAAHVAAMR
jgi:acyl-CoA thioesterase I